jgi:hypothetical protein
MPKWAHCFLSTRAACSSQSRGHRTPCYRTTPPSQRSCMCASTEYRATSARTHPLAIQWPGGSTDPATPSKLSRTPLCRVQYCTVDIMQSCRFESRGHQAVNATFERSGRTFGGRIIMLQRYLTTRQVSFVNPDTRTVRFDCDRMARVNFGTNNLWIMDYLGCIHQWPRSTGR